MPIVFTCVVCGAGFSGPPSRARLYCSKQCYGQASLRTDADFWGRVLKGGPDDCWPWRGATASNGYGTLKFNREYTYAHRLAWELTFGPTNRWVLHSCDTRLCCNPAHLFLGDHQVNMDDMSAKGRGRRPACTDAEVVDIRARHEAGASIHALARERGLDPMTVSRMVRGVTYQHVK